MAQEQPQSRTAVTDVRTVPLGRLSAAQRRAVRRIVPTGTAPKPPVAAFDSAM
jgi:FXSXX-COOH protein